MFMIHRFLIERIFGDSEEYEEFADYSSMMRRLVQLDKQDDGYTYWAEDGLGNIFNADEDCGYCGSSTDPNDICITCWDNMPSARDIYF